MRSVIEQLLAALAYAEMLESKQDVIHENISLLEIALDCAQRPAFYTM